MDPAGKIVGAIGIVIVVIVLLAMTPVIIDQVNVTSAVGEADKWNFTGASGALAILGLVPFVWIASILIAAAVGMFALAKGKD